MDIVINVENMPLVGETILGKDIKYVQGGKGANQAYAAGRLGNGVTMLGCVGQDDFGSMLINNLAEAGVSSNHLVRDKVESTGTAIIYINEEGNNNIVVVAGANSQCNVDYLREKDELFQQCDYVLLQMEIPIEAVYYAIERASELGKVVILNPAPAPDSIPNKILKKLDYITPNETELAKLSNQKTETLDEITCAAESLVAKGVKNVLVTLGERGALLVNENVKELYEAHKVENVVDTTAAGDCFNSAFIIALAEGKNHAHAISFANKASSIVVTRLGAQSSIPTREEVDQMMN